MSKIMHEINNEKKKMISDIIWAYEEDSDMVHTRQLIIEYIYIYHNRDPFAWHYFTTLNEHKKDIIMTPSMTIEVQTSYNWVKQYYENNINGRDKIWCCVIS